MSDIDDPAIVATRYRHEPDTTLVTCTLLLRTGFAIVGQASTVHPHLFDVEKGRTLAFQNALGRLREFEAFRLADHGAMMARSEA